MTEYRAKPPASPEPNHQSLGPTAETPTLAPTTDTGGDSSPDPAKLLAEVREMGYSRASIPGRLVAALSASLEREVKAEERVDRQVDNCHAAAEEIKTLRATLARVESWARPLEGERDALSRDLAAARGELSRCGRENCMGQTVEGVQRWVTEPRYLTVVAERDASALALREARERDLSALQPVLPWGNPYAEEFMSEISLYRDFRHALLHLMKSLGKLAAIVEADDHGGRPGETDYLKTPALVADVVICALRLGNTNPTPFDVLDAVMLRLDDKNPRWRALAGSVKP